VPPAPRLELELEFNLRQLRAEEERLLGAWAWADEAAGTVRIPISTALELAAAGDLPGVPRGAAPEPAAPTASPGQPADGAQAAGAAGTGAAAAPAAAAEPAVAAEEDADAQN
jgi:hypothetical protein